MEPVAGTVIDDKYRLVRALGEGGMSHVFEVEHVTLGKPFALKLAGPDVAADPELAARFENEARAAARVRGDHVVRVVDVGRWLGRPYLVMELLEGEDLERTIARSGRVPAPDAVDFVIEALAALADVHAAGIVHRDLKPSNLFLHARGGAKPVVKLVDFGVATTGIGGHARVTTTGSALGSPAYMSPEQLRSAKHVDARADLWSAGVILYELLTGALPFEGDQVGAMFAAILENEPAPPSARVAVPAGLEAVILRCLRKQPSERFASASELAAALAPWASADGRIVAEQLARAPAPPLEARLSVPSVPSVRVLAAVSTVPPAAARTWPPNVTPPRRPRAWLVPALAAGAVALAIVTVAVWRARAPESGAAVAPPPLAASLRATAVTDDTASVVPPTPTSTLAGSAPAAIAAASASASASAARPAPSASARPARRALPAKTADDDERIFGRH